MIPQPNYQFKFVLVGDSLVGKSSILTRFVDDSFDDNLLATIGVGFKFRRIKINNDDVKIQIWDTAGNLSLLRQDNKHLDHLLVHTITVLMPSLLYMISLPIVVSKSAIVQCQSVLQYWVKQAQNNNINDACIFIMGNKMDEPKRDIDNVSIQAILNNHKIDKSFEVSAKTGQKVQESFKQICKVLISKNKGQKKGDQYTSKGLTRPAPILKASDHNDNIKEKKKCCG